MADFNERLIFSLEVNAAEFGAKLKRVITAATKNLVPELTVRAADIKFVGKVRAVDLFDLSGLSALVAAAVGAGIQQGGAGAGVNIGRAVPAGQLTGKALTDLFNKTNADATKMDMQKMFGGGGNVVAKAISQQNELTYAVRQTNSALDLQSGKMHGPKEQTFVDITRQEKAQERLAAAQEKAQERIATAQEKAQERMQRAQEKAEARALKMHQKGTTIPGGAAGPDFHPFIDVTSNINKGIIDASRSAANLGKIFLTLPIKFVANELNGVHRILGRIASAASQAFAPVKAILGTLIQSSAILTGVAGSGFIFGGPAFLPVAGIRLATSALSELSDQQHDTSLSVTQFSGEISKLKGADRVEFINNKFRDLSATIQDTAIEFGISTKEVSAGLAEILGAQVGVSSLSERLAALGASARVAVGGATTVSDAFSGLLPIVKAFNVSFEDAADKLFAIQRIGVAPIKQLAPEIGRLASVARGAGVDLDDFGSAIGTLTEQGVPLNTVMTGLSNVFVEMSKGGNEQVQKLVSQVQQLKGLSKFSIGFNSIEQAGGLGAYLDMLREIADVAPELFAKLFPDARAVKVMLPAVASLNEFMKNRIEIMHAEGEAAAANAAVQQTLYKSIEKVKVAFSTSIVEIGNHIANVLQLKNVVDDVVESLKDFTETVRAISTPDLNVFIEDLLTSQDGVISLVDAIGEQVKRIVGFVVDLSPDIFRAFSVIGIGSGLILVRSIGNALKKSTDSFGNIADQLAKMTDGTIVGAPISAALRVAGLTTEAGGNILPSGSINDSIKAAAWLTPGREWFAGFADAINEELNSGAKSDGMNNLRNAFSSLLDKVDAKKLIDSTGRLADAMSQKLIDIKPFSKPLIDDWTNVVNVVKARPIAISILGGDVAAQNSITHVDEMLKSLRESMNANGMSNISLPTTFSNEAEIFKANDAYEELYATRQKVIEQMKKVNPDYNMWEDPDLKGINDSVQEAFSRLYYAKKQGVISKDVFDAIGIKNAGNDVRHQLIAVEEEFLRMSSVINGGGDLDGSLKKRLPLVDTLRHILATRSIDPRDTSFNLEAFQKKAEVKAKMVSENIRDNFSEMIGRGFELNSDFINPIKIKGDMSKNDLMDYSKGVKAYGEQLKAILADNPEDSATHGLRQYIIGTISSVGSLVLAIDGISKAFHRASNVGGDFDTILITVGNKAKAMESMMKGLAGAIESTADSLSRLSGETKKNTDAINSAAAASTAAAAAFGTAAGPQTLQESGFGKALVYNDMKVQTINVTPAAVGAVVRPGSDAASGLNSQNIAPK